MTPPTPRFSYSWCGPLAAAEAGNAQPELSYIREQILSTSLFRAYRAIGGDSTRREQRLHAARYMAYLILQAASLLPTVNHHAGGTVEDFVLKLGAADGADRFVAGPTAANPLFGELPGGAVYKVIEWAFEEQGLFVPPTATPPCPKRGPHGTGPSSGKGQLPDLYIGANRAGYLPYREGIFDTTDDLWIQAPGTAPNPGAALPAPLVNQPNAIFVRVRNRGVGAATGVTVTVHWQANRAATEVNLAPGGGWTAATPPATPPPSLAGTGAGPGCVAGSAIFGPFAWKPPPSAQGWVLLAKVSNAGDASTLDSTFPCAQHPLPLERLLPYDNNLALRRF